MDMTLFPTTHRVKPVASPASRIVPETKEAAHYWPLLDALTKARKHYDLLPATLVVLKALCSFLPRQALEDDAPMLVWPSNATLMDRCSGLPERSLRRHIDRLISAGFITRKSSANGKRFALRIRHSIVDAFGFDLQPLFNRQEEILQAAEDAQALSDVADCLRSQIRIALNNALLAGVAPDDDTQHQIICALRRVADINLYRQILTELQQAMNDDFLSVTVDMAATNSQNGRHLQNTNKESIQSVFVTSTIEKAQNAEAIVSASDNLNLPSLPQCKDSLKLSCDFSPEPIENWQDLQQHAQNLSPMIGIERKQIDQAIAVMGQLPACVSLLCLVQLSEKLHRPAAYLQRLIQRAMTGSFSLSGLLRAAEKMNPSAAA